MNEHNLIIKLHKKWKKIYYNNSFYYNKYNCKYFNYKFIKSILFE